jgi:hypothetical protein
MKIRIGVLFLLCTLLASCLVLLAQEKSEAQETGGQAAASPATDKELQMMRGTDTASAAGQRQFVREHQAD